MKPIEAGISADLFEATAALPLDEGAVLLRGFALPSAQALLDDIAAIVRQAPFRRLTTPGGQRMSVAMSNCGALGWLSDRRGYRYEPCDPLSGRVWPAMPEHWARLAASAAARGGFGGFVPDACLINRYEPGARMSLHQDRDEQDRRHPIVSLSLGLPTEFLWGADTRRERPRKVMLRHGDAVVWGGAARLRFHGVAALAAGEHALTGRLRYNLTFRKAA